MTKTTDDTRHIITPLYACSFNLSSDQYQTRFEDLNTDGYRLVFVDGFRSTNGLRYAGIWMRDRASAFTQARQGMTSDEYQSVYDDLRKRGYLIQGVTGLSSSSGSSKSYFAAVWNDGSFRGHQTHHGMTASEYQSKFEEYAADGYNIIYVTGYAEKDTSRYAAIWFNGTDIPRTARHNLPSADYQSVFDEYKKSGYRIFHVNAHAAGDKTYFARIWIKENGYNPFAKHNMSLDNTESIGQQFASEDYRMTCLSQYQENGEDRCASIWVPNQRNWIVQGPSDSSLAAFDSVIETLMKKNTLPGASFAITRNNQLIAARGYSWITEIESVVQPTSLFRLASVSKTFTGPGIIRLCEDKLLSDLDNKLVDLIGMPGTISDTDINTITVDHLLHHVGGWNSDSKTGSGVDPMVNDIKIAD